MVLPLRVMAQGPRCTLGEDVNVSNLPGQEAEVSIDVNPTNPDNLVVIGHIGGFDTMNTFYSLDGGETWTLVSLGNADDGITSGFRFDPSVLFDDLGNLYVAYGARNFDGPTRRETLVVCKSTDGGQSYPQCSEVHTQNSIEIDGDFLTGNDKWHMAVATPTVAPELQNLYIAWTQNVVESGNLDQRIVVSRSADGGVTWSTPQIIADDANADADRSLTADPTVGPNGELYVSWHDFGEDQILLDVSTDGGISFGTDIFITNVGFSGLFDPIPAQPDRRITPGPMLDVDRSGGPNNGRIYLAYTDIAAGGLPDTDVFVRFSDDHGASWSAPLRVNDDAGTNSQFLPWLDVDQTTGTVQMVWYDARNDGSNQQVEAFVAASNDGGATFTINTPLSDGVSDQSASNPGRWGNNFLEYIGIVGLDCSAVAVWSDNSLDLSNLDYFVDRFVPSFCGSPPTASASDQFVECEGGGHALVTLDGSGSSDVDGDIVDYEWYDGATLVGTGATLAVSVPLGVHQFTLRVRDATGLFDCTTSTITVVDTIAPTVTAPADMFAECTGPGGTAVVLGTPVVDELCDPGNVVVGNDAPALFSLGATLVTWSATDGSGNVGTATQTVTIVDTTPPEISVTVSPEVLWPPNHKLVEITPVLTVSDICDPSPTVELLDITMNEGTETLTFDPAFDVTLGDGHTLDDIQVIGGQIFLRAERSGTGDGRVYTITYIATDASGNTALATATVTVPLNL